MNSAAQFTTTQASFPSASAVNLQDPSFQATGTYSRTGYEFQASQPQGSWYTQFTCPSPSLYTDGRPNTAYTHIRPPMSPVANRPVLQPPCIDSTYFQPEATAPDLPFVAPPSVQYVDDPMDVDPPPVASFTPTPTPTVDSMPLGAPRPPLNVRVRVRDSSSNTGSQFKPNHVYILDYGNHKPEAVECTAASQRSEVPPMARTDNRYRLTVKNIRESKVRQRVGRASQGSIYEFKVSTANSSQPELPQKAYECVSPGSIVQSEFSFDCDDDMDVNITVEHVGGNLKPENTEHPIGFHVNNRLSSHPREVLFAIPNGTEGGFVGHQHIPGSYLLSGRPIYEIR